MKKQITDITLDQSMTNYIQRIWNDYSTRKDILVSLFEQYKFDNATVLEGEPFTFYEKRFEEAKVAYDIAMEEIRTTIIPSEYREDKYSFDIDFSQNVIRIYAHD